MQMVMYVVAIDRLITQAISRQGRLEGLMQSRVRKPLTFHTLNSAVYIMCLLLLTEIHFAFKALEALRELSLKFSAEFLTTFNLHTFSGSCFAEVKPWHC